MLSLGKMRCAKGECDLKLSEVALHAEGIALIAMPGEDLDAFEAALPAMCAALAGDAACRGGASLSRRRSGADRAARPAGQGATGWSILATNDVHYHEPEPPPVAGRDELHPREGDAGRGAGYLLNPNAERHLKSPAEMARLFARWPHAIEATREFADSDPLQPRRIEI